MMLNVLGRNNSSNVQKVLWALEEMGVDYSREDYGGPFGKTKDDYYLSLNPNSVVPTIIDEGANDDGSDFVLWESNACVRYLAAKHSMGNLCPASATVRASADRWMDWQHTTVAPPITPVFWGLIRTAPEDRDLDAIEAGRVGTQTALARLDAQLADNTFVNGETFTMADIPLGIMVYRWFTMDIKRADMPNLSRYYGQLGERKPFQDTVMIGLT